ncbi:hypothetical protein [Escherichia coli]|uniref:hypothetical protein n=1 Tax=Escherichia coli TaxID=562 RepID=UPI0014851EA3|nr:hypothetical protein [Escherichia coli]
MANKQLWFPVNLAVEKNKKKGWVGKIARRTNRRKKKKKKERKKKKEKGLKKKEK